MEWKAKTASTYTRTALKTCLLLLPLHFQRESTLLFFLVYSIFVSLQSCVLIPFLLRSFALDNPYEGIHVLCARSR